MACQSLRKISDRPSNSTSKIRFSLGSTIACAAPILHTGHVIMRRCWKARRFCSLRIQLWDLITLLIPGLSVGHIEQIHPPLLILQAETRDRKKRQWGFKSMVHFTSNETPVFVSSPLKGFIFPNGFILYSAPFPYSVSLCGCTNNGNNRSIFSIDSLC